MDDPDLVATLEGCALHAWPALREQPLGGWTARFGAGFTRRSNSVQALAAQEGDVQAAIARCEALYAAAGQPCIFKLTPLARPRELDALLAARGYRREGETRVQRLPQLAPGAVEAGCERLSALDPAWLEAFTRMDRTPEAHRPTLRALLERIAPAHTGALLREGGHVAACGRAVREGDWVGLYDIATDAAQRRRGFGRRVILDLLAWGREQGARQAYLQVEAENAAALQLYAGLGFRDVYRYAYRVRP